MSSNLSCFHGEYTKIIHTEEVLVGMIRERIIAGIGLSPHLVQILEPGTLPRTSSGKIRHLDALKMFLAAELVPPEKMGTLKIII